MKDAPRKWRAGDGVRNDRSLLADRANQDNLLEGGEEPDEGKSHHADAGGDDLDRRIGAAPALNGMQSRRPSDLRRDQGGVW